MDSYPRRYVFKKVFKYFERFHTLSQSKYCSDLVHAMNLVQSRALERISFYKVTTKFAQYMKKTKQFDHLHITGHSKLFLSKDNWSN